MADYTLVLRIPFNALDDLQARQAARDMLDQMRVAQVYPQAKLVLRRQGPDQSRNLLAELSADDQD